MRRAPVGQECPLWLNSGQMARHRVVALALEPLVALDLAAPAHVFGHWGGERYSFHRVAGADGSPVATSSGFAVDVEAGLGALRRADTVVVPGYEGASRPHPEPVLGRAATRRRPRGARDVDLHRRLRARPRGPAGRPPRHHPLGLGGDLRRAVPCRAARPGCALRRRGTAPEQAPAWPPGSTSACTWCAATTAAAGGRPDRPADRGGAPPRGRPGAVHRARAPAGDGRGGAARGHARLGAQAPGAGASALADLARARLQVAAQRTFARRFRAETGTSPHQWLLSQRVLQGPAAARGGRHCPVDEIRRLRLRRRRRAALPLPPRGGHDAERLPAQLSRR